MSDSYDPEWSTGEQAGEICEALDAVYQMVCVVLNQSEPIYILDLVRNPFPKKISAMLSEKQWRLIRFALERAKDSI